MTHLRGLASLIKELEDQLITCMRCGFCQAHCPLFAETKREADVARGKLALLDGLAKEMLKDPQGVKERLERCLLCGSCAAACPSGVQTQEIFIKARAVLSGYLGLPPLKKADIPPGPGPSLCLQSFAGSWARPMQNAMARPASEILGTSCSRMDWPLGRRHFKRLAPLPFHSQIPAAHAEKAGAERRQGCLFHGLPHRPGISPGGPGRGQGFEHHQSECFHTARPGLLRHAGPVGRGEPGPSRPCWPIISSCSSRMSSTIWSRPAPPAPRP